MGKDNLGRSLTKSRKKKTQFRPDLDAAYRTNDEDKERSQKMKSHTDERTDLEELMELAELDERTFEAEKQNVVVITSTATQRPSRIDIDKERSQNWNILTIPRRPAWTAETTPEDLNKMERDMFVEWRKNLAQIEEESKLTMTPFEKNLEVWRQLWRVIEKSDLVCQILDARNPLLFRCPDLEKYVQEIDKRKKTLLIVNKADLLTKRQRFFWAKYFTASGLDYVFFSANAENEPTKPSEHQRAIHIFSQMELIELFSEICPSPIDPVRTTVVVGLVGYPNVGKSSTVNTLVGDKKVAVAATPGKTKHFQTIVLTDKITLCDCPGLVFPTVVGTKADMVCDGLLPIDQMREFIAPVQVVCDHILREVLEGKYGVVLSPPTEARPKPSSEEFLNAFAFVRGFVTSSGLPDQSRAARIVLKDYVQGRLLYCHPPPGFTEEEYTPKKNKKLNQDSEDNSNNDNNNSNENTNNDNRKPTYVENSPNSPYSEQYDQLEKQKDVVALTKGKFAKFNYTRSVEKPYSPIPISQLKKDPKLMAALERSAPYKG